MDIIEIWYSNVIEKRAAFKRLYCRVFDFCYHDRYWHHLGVLG